VTGNSDIRIYATMDITNNFTHAIPLHIVIAETSRYILEGIYILVRFLSDLMRVRNAGHGKRLYEH